MKHDIDPMTYYCIKCGQSAALIFDKEMACNVPPNLVAISHIVSMRRFREISDKIRYRP